MSERLFDTYKRPYRCKQCDGVMVFKGVGEYHCEECGFVEYDEYGKVRIYLEKHRGATITEIADVTGVSQKNIRQMIKEARFEITADSRSFLTCERCKCTIRSGRYCSPCEQIMHQSAEAEERARSRARNEEMQGYGKASNEAKGEKRFKR